MNALAIDLGGTKIDAALVDDRGEIVPGSRHRAPTGRDLTPEGLREAIDQVVSGALGHLPGDEPLAATGIGSAGPIDAVNGVIHPVNLPGVRGFALVEAVRDVLIAATGEMDPVVTLRHDGGCLALAESWRGAARDARASLSIVVSTGVGGGIVVDGRPLGGATGNAGHLGQTHLGELTLEEIASGPGSVQWARLHGWSGSTGEDLGRDAAAGDRTARDAIIRSAKAVGAALADAAALIDLDLVVISGGFSRVSDDYVDLVQEALRDWAGLEHLASIPVVRSALGEEGPLIGAAALVWRR